MGEMEKKTRKETITNKEYAAGQEVKTSPEETASGPVSAATPLERDEAKADAARVRQANEATEKAKVN